ncbi:SCO7613 C-terminal domain-containing membrane protein [Streptomyces sp. NPDC013457]|uniref:SCO7613 C-terminal domain-containing membrane protein n=1 Tax=Streptomyces sp. NPDC013457 TaxID=3364866 RepID=UPI0036FE68C1
MDNALPPADELVLVDRELARLDARRSQLLARRAWLLHVLRAPAAFPAPPRAVAGPVGDSTPRSAQNVLLTLGGVLLTIAALAFTLVSWGSMGIGGRAAVLAAVTSAALVVPVVLLRRGLGSTAEAVAALGLVLMVLDAYALHRVALPDTDGPAFAAVASAVLAGAWTAYGTVLGRLRLPLPAAVIAAQLPLPLAVLAADGGPLALGWAALATAALDLAVVLRAKPAPVRVTAGVGAGVLGGWALLAGGGLSLSSPVPAGALLVAGSAVALVVAWRAPRAAVAASVVAGLAVVAAAGGVLRLVLPGDWEVPGYVLCAVAPACALRSAAPRGVRTGLAAAGAGVLALGVLWSLPPVGAALLGPVARTAPVWSGIHADRVLAWYPSTAPVVLIVAATAFAALPRLWSRCTALFLAWAALTALPLSLELSYGATLALQLVTTTAALALACRPTLLTRGLPSPAESAARPPDEVSGAATRTSDDAETAAERPDAAGPEGSWHGWGPVRPAAVTTTVPPREVFGWSAFGCGLVSALSTVAVALDTRGATFGALGVLLGLFVAGALLSDGARRAVAACAAVVVATGLVSAGAATAGFQAPGTALALLLVPTATALLGARLRRHPVALPVEVTGAAVALFAVTTAATSRPAVLALTLALAGVIAAATAVRPERRPLASWTAGALFLLATWVRLAAWEVTTPEAYTLPVTAPALVVGVLRRRRDPQASSWVAYGPGLAATLVPGLFAAWADPDWPRPLLLGVAALVVTLLGARFRLQALLVLGGTVLALDGLHELAPYVVQAVGALPRWLPPALAGLLLLAVGATYEQRLRDARRLRERLGRMR